MYFVNLSLMKTISQKSAVAWWMLTEISEDEDDIIDAILTCPLPILGCLKFSVFWLSHRSSTLSQQSMASTTMVAASAMFTLWVPKM